MTSLDFKALLAKERAKMRANIGGSSDGSMEGVEGLVLGARQPLDWAGHATSFEGIIYVPGASVCAMQTGLQTSVHPPSKAAALNTVYAPLRIKQTG